MGRHNIIFWLLGICAVVVSCTTDDSVSRKLDTERYEFVLSVGHPNGMRMANDVVQADGSYRGLQYLCVIPFRTDAGTGEAEAVAVDDFPLISIATGAEANKVTRTDTEKYYYIEHCSLKEETNRVLVYGQALPKEGKETLDQNGKLETEVGTHIVPSEIMFSLKSICEEDDADEDVFDPAWDLADYLTAIANTEGWSTTDDETMKSLYLAFIHADAGGTGLMAGSAANVSAYVTALRDKLKNNTDALSIAIVANIDDEDLSACLDNGYPSASTSLGLPDGTAALRWTGNGFSVRTVTTTLDNINNIKRYTYPAELWYYTNSAIYTSEEKELIKDEIKTEDWNTLLGLYDKRYITIETQSVAVEQPLQYGVGCLETTLTPVSGELRDAKNEVVNYVSANKLPLTAVIVGGQHTVGFDFKPQGEQSDVDTRIIYDKEVGNTGIVNTLVLQTYDGEKVPVVLELENLTGKKFTGKDGIIYPNTKFYLIAEINPAGMGEGDCAGRVFTQDYTTKVNMTVTSLAKAYSCMPDLLSARLEIGVQVKTQWILSTPTTVKL